jgi:hypothetical protein
MKAVAGAAMEAKFWGNAIIAHFYGSRFRDQKWVGQVGLRGTSAL